MTRHTKAGNRLLAGQKGSRRQAARSEAWRQRLAEARTAEARLNVACDWLRSSVQRMAKQATRTGETPNRPAAERVMREVSDYLARVAAGIDDGHGGDSE